MKRNTYWFKLDNAAKIFPAVSNHKRSSVFRLSFYLTEEINKDLLQSAQEDTLVRFEPFAVTIKRGLFWYYFTKNTRIPQVKKESAIFCKYVPWTKNRGYLFTLYYYKNKITLETFHALSDGTGALEFLKAITYRYLTLSGKQLEAEDKVLGTLPKEPLEAVDMFTHSYEKHNKMTLQEEPAYHIKGERFKDNFSLAVKIQVPTDELLTYTRSISATFGEYITALYAYSIYTQDINCHGSKKPIKIFVPVNLRRFFQAPTLRNFSLYIKATFSLTRTWTFEEMLTATKEQFKEQLNKEAMHRRMNANVEIEKNPFVRILPLCIKDIAFKLGYFYLAENINTSAISNLANVTLPDDMTKYITDAEFSIGGTSMAIVSYHGTTNIMMNSETKDLSIIHFLTRELTKAGLKVSITSNYREEYDEVL